MKHLRSTLLAATAAAIVAGCGEDADGEPAASAAPAATGTAAAKPPEPTGLSHEELVDELNRICAKVNAVSERANRELEAVKTQDDAYARAGDIAARAADTQADGVQDLEQLEANQQDQPALKRFVAAARRTSAITSRIADALAAQDATEIASLNEAADRGKKQRLDAALDLGADNCGR